jgi:hypothetical protein
MHTNDEMDEGSGLRFKRTPPASGSLAVTESGRRVASASLNACTRHILHTECCNTNAECASASAVSKDTSVEQPAQTPRAQAGHVPHTGTAPYTTNYSSLEVRDLEIS